MEFLRIIFSILLLIPALSWGQDKAESESFKYWNEAIILLEEDKIDEAQLILSKTAELGGDEYAAKAQILLAYIESSSGKLSTRESSENASEIAFFKADGLETHGIGKFDSKSIAEATRQYIILLSADRSSKWAHMAQIRSSSLLVLNKQYRRALIPLMQVVEQEEVDEQLKSAAWFFMGRIFIESPEFQNRDQARRAFENVLKFKQSLFYKQARKYLKTLAN